MQIPALVVAVRKRPLHQIEVMPHGPMHDRAILRCLLFSDCSTMPWDRQDRTGTIGEIHPTSAGAHLHDIPREVTSRMIQSLFGRRDVAAGGVIVRAEVQPAAPSARRFNQFRNAEGSGSVDDRLWSFNHQLDLDRARRQPMPQFQALEYFHQLRYLPRLTDLRQSHHEIVR